MTPPDSQERYLGEYRLIQLIALKPPAQRWYAEQTSIARPVLIDELQNPDPDQRAQFLANVKAKAAVEHPLVASVYEAVSQDDVCFYAHEVLPGVSLADRLEANAALRPLDLAHLIRRVSEAQLHMQQAGIATAMLELRHIHLDDQGLIRLENLAIHGVRDAGQSARDVTALGTSLRPLVADAQAGATRVLTLLEWMRGSAERPPLEWDQIRDVALQIEQQLTQPMVSSNALVTGAVSSSPSRGGLVLYVGITVVILLAAFVIYSKTKPANPQYKPVDKPLATIDIPAGKYVTPDGASDSMPAFRIAPHEVTIRDYAEFLATLDTLAKDNRDKTFDHEDQPASKVGHLPDDWVNLHAAAKSNGLWNTRTVTLDHPVVGVDWWDAIAYAEWKKGRLPTQEEWFAALHYQNPNPGSLPASGWLPVTTDAQDRTPAGIMGMAGSVAEWTRRQAANPANPLGARKWVLMGGSYYLPGTNGLTRSWVDDRSVRRPDLGFRLVFDPS